MDITGKIHTVGETESKGANGFKVKKIIIDRTWYHPEDGRPIENFTEVTLTGDKTSLADGVAVGDKVKATIRLSGRFFEHDGQTKFAQDVVVNSFTITEKAQNETKPQEKPTEKDVYGQANP